MRRARKLPEAVRQTRGRVQIGSGVRGSHSDVVLLDGETHFRPGLEAAEAVVAPGTSELPRDPGVSRLTDEDQALRVLPVQHAQTLPLASHKVSLAIDVESELQAWLDRYAD